MPNWIGYNDYTAGADTMTIYGNIGCFDCSENGSNVTGLDVSQNKELVALYCFFNQISSLDVSQNTKLAYLACNNNQLSSLDISQNTKLKELSCHKNLFTTEIVDEIFCSLPDKEVADNAKIYILNNASDDNHDTVLATNKQNAIDKNWEVLYFDDYSGPLFNEDIPTTTGDYECPVSTSEVYLSDLILYPNPVTAGFTIETQDRGILEIYSVTGQKVGSTQITNNKQFIYVSNLKSGIYITKINGRVVKFAKR